MFWIGWYWGFLTGSLCAAPFDEVAPPLKQRQTTRVGHFDSLALRDDDDAIMIAMPPRRASDYSSQSNVICLFGPRS